MFNFCLVNGLALRYPTVIVPLSTTPQLIVFLIPLKLCLEKHLSGFSLTRAVLKIKMNDAYKELQYVLIELVATYSDEELRGKYFQ